MQKSWIGLRNLPFLQLIPFQDNVCYRKVQGINIISCFRKHDVLMKYERHIKQVWHFILISRDKEICSPNGSNKLSRVTAQGQLTFRHLQQRNILIFRGYSHFYQSGYTSLPLVIRSIIYHNHLIFQRTLGRVVCYVILSIFVYYYNIQYVVIIYSRLYIFTILPSIVDDPVTVDLKMMRDEWNSTLFQKLFSF